jgi:hypothetical protein
MRDNIPPQYCKNMNALAGAIDELFNGKPMPGREPTVGFVLLVARFGEITDGRVNYISNGRREDMVAMLREYLARADAQAPIPANPAPLQGEAWYWRNMFALKRATAVADHYGITLAEVTQIRKGEAPIPANPAPVDAAKGGAA